MNDPQILGWICPSIFLLFTVVLIYFSIKDTSKIVMVIDGFYYRIHRNQPQQQANFVDTLEVKKQVGLWHYWARLGNFINNETVSPYKWMSYEIIPNNLSIDEIKKPGDDKYTECIKYIDLTSEDVILLHKFMILHNMKYTSPGLSGIIQDRFKLGKLSYFEIGGDSF